MEGEGRSLWTARRSRETKKQMIKFIFLILIALSGCTFSLLKSPVVIAQAPQVTVNALSIPNLPAQNTVLTILKILGTLALAAAAGWCYRFGGAANGRRWVRQVGDGLCEAMTFFMWFGFSWWLIGIMGSIWATSTYFRVKGSEVNLQWWNWLLVGIIFALVPLPWVLGTWITHWHHPTALTHWRGFLCRSAFIIPVTTLVQIFFGGNVKFSEPFRGIIQIITCLFFLIPD